MTSSFSAFCNSLTCTWTRRPLKCSVPMPSTISSKCPQMRASRAARSRESFGEGDSLLNVGFRSSSSRCSSLLPSLLAATLPPSRRCRLNGALLGELLFVTGLPPLLETDLRTEPCDKLFATDASPSGAGGCSASITREDWLALYDLAEEIGEHVRLDRKGQEPPSKMHDVRAAGAPLALRLMWTTLFSYRFFAGKQINRVELESLDQPPQAGHT